MGGLDKRSGFTPRASIALDDVSHINFINVSGSSADSPKIRRIAVRGASFGEPKDTTSNARCHGLRGLRKRAIPSLIHRSRIDVSTAGSTASSLIPEHGWLRRR